MLKNSSLKLKLFAGFGVILIILSSLGGYIYINLNTIASAIADYSHYSEYDKLTIQRQLDHFKWLTELNRTFLLNASSFSVQLDPTKCGLGEFLLSKECAELSQSPEINPIISQMTESHKHLHESAAKMNTIWRRIHEGLEGVLKDRLDDHRVWASAVANMIISNDTSVPVQIDSSKCALGKWLSSPEYRELVKIFPEFEQIMNELSTPHDKLHASASDIISSLQSQNFDTAKNTYQTTTLPLLEEIHDIFHRAINAEHEAESAQKQAKNIYSSETLIHLENTQKHLLALGNIMQKYSAKAFSHQTNISNTSQHSIIAAIIFSLAVGLFIAFFLSNSLTKTLRTAIAIINTGSQQVSQASEQVAQTGISISESTSEQAASLEETSASLEEITAMLKNTVENAILLKEKSEMNYDNSSEASTISVQASDQAAYCYEILKKLLDSLKKIETSSIQTGKIIKNIDEIAFQTNLLALNAAVEAARAGDAGRGFSVVAEEVRSLAQRSAEAARNTAELIDESKNSVKSGMNIFGEFESIISELINLISRSADSTGKVSSESREQLTLIDEVARAASQISNGVEQINISVAQLDTVTQNNAAMSEESSAAAEELSGQSADLMGAVAELAALVEGRNKASNTESPYTNKTENLPLPKNTYRTQYTNNQLKWGN